MKIKKRIFLSNALMVWVSLLALLAIGCLAMGLMRSRMMDEIAGDARLDENLLTVHSTLSAFVGEDWESLEAALAPTGYSLYILGEGETSYAPRGRWEEEISALLQKETLPPEGISVYHAAGVTVLARRVSGEAGEYLLAAAHTPEHTAHTGMGAGGWERFLLSFLLFGTLIASVILLISQLFTRRLVQRIMVPIEALTESARRIEEGDLSLPIDYRGEEEFVTVCTAFNGMQAHLLEEQEKNARYEKARTDMISGISHDLRTPLTSVKGYIKGIQDGVASTPEKVEHYLATAYRKACDMDTLLEQLFYFSKLETGNLPFFPTRCDLGAFVEGYVAEVAGELRERGVDIHYERPTGPHPVEMDPQQMERVLRNLTENALKYAGVPALSLTLSVYRKEGREELRFADNGVGISPEKLPHIFQQFYRGDEARSGGESASNGLGLYIVQYIAGAHGGTATAENAGGLAITLSLPIPKGGA